MANFNTHMNVAFAASGLAGLVMLSAGMVTPTIFVCCVLMGTIGGLLPDLDSDNSTPLTVGFTIVSMFIAFGAVIWLNERLMLVELVALWAITFATIRYGIFKLFTLLTVHRGVMHSVPYAFLFGLIVLYWCFYGLHMSARNSWFLGVFTTFGALVHLILDECYSVNLLNVEIKKSFGTALKVFTQKDKYWFVALYVAVIAGFYTAPSGEEFWLSMNNQEAWQMLGERLIR